STDRPQGVFTMARSSNFRAAPWLLALLVVPFVSAEEQTPRTPPKTRTDNVEETLHGVKIVDPYRWLEDQKSPETRAWIESQNAYTQAVLGAWPGREQLKQRLGELLKVNVIGMPTEHGGRYFFSKRLANQDLSVLYMREGLKGKDEVLIDPHTLSADRTKSVNYMGFSKD